MKKRSLPPNDPLEGMMAKSGQIDPPGLTFTDGASGRRMKYVYPSTQHWTAGWILYKHPQGHWVTLRKATDDDITRISSAVVEAHHRG
jgi:hypothetical protein